MPKCAYPSCVVQIESGGDNPPPFCEKHQAVKCVLPSCKETVIPNSGWCQVHNDLTIFFDFIHPLRHQEALQMQQAAQQAQQVMRQAGLGNGKGNMRVMRP